MSQQTLFDITRTIAEKRHDLTDGELMMLSTYLVIIQAERIVKLHASFDTTSCVVVEVENGKPN